MKKLIAGLGLTVLAVPSAHAWSGGIEDMRTMRANQSYPIVRVKSHRVTTCCGYQRAHIRHNQCHQQMCRPQATGWQRNARIGQHPMKPVRMTAYYNPRPIQRAPVQMHRIVGTAQPMCRYIR